LHLASQNGHTHIADWWANSGLLTILN
jgi:hypothetical protein